MNNKEITQDDCFAKSPLPGVGVPGAQPVAGSRGGQSIPKVSRKKSGNKSAKTKRSSSKSFQLVPISGAKAQENRRKNRTDAGQSRVETWVPLQVAQHMKAKAESQKMTGQEFLAKLIVENLASI